MREKKKKCERRSIFKTNNIKKERQCILKNTDKRINGFDDRKRKKN
jgi:hypothetical protein